MLASITNIEPLLFGKILNSFLSDDSLLLSFLLSFLFSFLFAWQSDEIMKGKKRKENRREVKWRKEKKDENGRSKNRSKGKKRKRTKWRKCKKGEVYILYLNPKKTLSHTIIVESRRKSFQILFPIIWYYSPYLVLHFLRFVSSIERTAPIEHTDSSNTWQGILAFLCAH